MRKRGLQAELNGKAKGKVYKIAPGQFVELAREGEGAVWTVLGAFADVTHNHIPQPDRAADNSTMWVANFDRTHYQDMLFNDSPGMVSLRNFYKEQSSNRYTVHGDVTDWVRVPGDAADYAWPAKGTAVWDFIGNSANAWYAAQIAAGRTPDEINTYLGQFDKWDRYDYDHDGNFDEPDGYIDTFQSIHAGQGQEANGATTAIWSHSWYAYYTLQGIAGPSFNKMGGVRVGNSNYWIGKYTIQPENGGVGVFAHEFGHDLGVPDLYDTACGDNGTGFWTLMSAGSWLGDGTVDIGTKPSHMGAWEKFLLGWLNYEVAVAGRKTDLHLGPMEANTKQAQGLFVVLPNKRVESNIGAPYSGSYYYSGAGDNLDSFMYRPVSLPQGATLTAQVKYDIEADSDYAYLVYSTDNGATWTPVETSLSTTTNPNGQNKGFGITGASGNWVRLTANLPAGNVLLGFRYRTDANTGGFGFMVDDIDVTGFTTDGAETSAGWTYAPTTGFHRTNGIEVKYYSQYYVAELRTYYGYDASLKTGPMSSGTPRNRTSSTTSRTRTAYWSASGIRRRRTTRPAGTRVPECSCPSMRTPRHYGT